MPINPWIAIEATTSPSLRTRELRHAWDEYLSEGRLNHVRGPIADSWSRSVAAGVDPSHAQAPTLLADRGDVRERWEGHPLEAVAPLIRRWLGPLAADSEHLIVVSNADGLLLWIDGDATIRSAAADAMNFVEGSLWSEAGVGTNAIGTALAADHLVQVHAAEHLSEIVHGWSCSAAPVHDPEDGSLLGIIDLTGRAADVTPAHAAITLAVGRAVEAQLRVRAQERDARLRVRYLDQLASATQKIALVSYSGRVIADHPAGLIRAERIEVSPGGGLVLLSGGRVGFAEPSEHQDSYLVRLLHDQPRGRRLLERVPAVSAQAADAAQPTQSYDASEWRRAQLELTRLAEEQAALRHVATLVAGQSTPQEIFETVAHEVARLFGADRATVARYEPDGTMTIAAIWTSVSAQHSADGPIEAQCERVAAMVQQSGRPSRIDGNAELADQVGGPASELDAASSTVGAPILADGRVWGVVLVASTGHQPLVGTTEVRLLGFAELIATAISNAVARAELNASRARIVAAADASRRRFERDLHDGAQQRLATVALQLRAAALDDTGSPEHLRQELSRAADAVTTALEEVREIAHGIHPAILSEAGLAPALRGLARRLEIPVELAVSASERLPEQVEVAAFYIASELLANVVKHAHASVVRVAAERANNALHLSIRDDGRGGADPTHGSGLIGVCDRAEAIGGTVVLDSPAGAGTTVLVSLPIGG
ncbi:MAG: hypothetical protein QOI15_2172 [Pseudonocardiales bacterium]|nr:hypothetical protein [Pseudonocardiales bacterium]